jgi:hypothetical protein
LAFWSQNLPRPESILVPVTQAQVHVHNRRQDEIAVRYSNSQPDRVDVVVAIHRRGAYIVRFVRGACFHSKFRGIGLKYLFRCFPHKNATPSFRRTAFLLSRVCADIV